MSTPASGGGSDEEPIQAVDLFCGAGGLSAGLARACEELDREVELVAVNHWTKAIKTHKQNHPWATHRNAKVEQVEPRTVVDSENVQLLTGGPQCTHFSSARGGKPVDEQKRASPWHVLDWVSKLLPENILIENVPEFRSWGPVIDGDPTRNGKFFEAWTETLEGLGYSVAWRVLNAADYGDATSRERLFIIARRDNLPTWPDQTRSKNGEEPGTDPWRTAAEIIDWSDRGESIWERSTPLVNNTMQRIAEGIRRFGDNRFEAYADAIDELTKRDVEALQRLVVPVEDAQEAAKERNYPFLVRGPALEVAEEDEETPTTTGLCLPYILGQHSNSQPRNAEEQPIPTVATSGAIQLLEPESFVLPRNGYQRGLHSNPGYDPNERPLHTVTASNHDGHLVTPYLITYNGNSGSEDIGEPLPTVTTKERFALVIPEHYPWGLDVRYRMLQPRELAAAMGFEDYEFHGGVTDTREQIGNAVPVNLAKALCKTLLVDSDPTLQSFTSTEEPIQTDGGRPE